MPGPLSARAHVSIQEQGDGYGDRDRDGLVPEGGGTVQYNMKANESICLSIVMYYMMKLCSQLSLSPYQFPSLYLSPSLYYYTIQLMSLSNTLLSISICTVDLNGRIMSARALNILQQRTPTMSANNIHSAGGGFGTGQGLGNMQSREHTREGTKEGSRGREREREGTREGSRGREREGTKEGSRGKEREREGTREGSRGRERDRDRESSKDKEIAIVSTIDGIDSKMSDLKSLFRKGDPLERRGKAATK